ncbi:GFA family protein [Sphingomonas sp. AX6]|uniref:GFA family protein n=1 Tax=Sphingomonas sp. AX6 TaxID=2653171 RepID=UPI0012F3CF76|nr:hypothetical protein SPHINGOAX6_70072 [Sphingomonas sp. AX6]
MKAQCQCGQLIVTMPGPTVAVVACHCIACQRRTGSPVGVAAYYPDSQVIVSGQSKRFERPTALGATLENFFCPDCGSTVYFRGSKNAGVTGIPIGAFVDPNAMVPIRSVGAESTFLGFGAHRDAEFRARASVTAFVRNPNPSCQRTLAYQAAGDRLQRWQAVGSTSWRTNPAA